MIYPSDASDGYFVIVRAGRGNTSPWATPRLVGSGAAAGVLLACAALLFVPVRASAKPRVIPGARKAHKKDAPDPGHYFATRVGLIRVYEERSKPGVKKELEEGASPAAGASCEVVESRPREGDSPASTRESCTMIVARKAKLASQLTYELRKAGIFMVRAEQEGSGKPAVMERLLLPAPVSRGKSWSEPRGKALLSRTVKSVGRACKAAQRSFGDCLVLEVKEHQGKKKTRGYTETYAAGVGLVEDSQWELIDVKGL